VAVVDLPVAVMAVTVLALLGWYFYSVTLRIRAGVQQVQLLPGHLQKAFDGSVPPWLRLVRVIMIVMISFAAALLIARKF